MNAGKVDLLVVMGANPVYEAPADLGFEDAYKKIALRVHHGLYQDETGSAVALAHQRARIISSSGAMCARSTERCTIQQPLIAPLYNGKSQYELLSALNGQGSTSGYESVRSTWQKQHAGARL